MFGRLLPYDINAQEYLSASKITDPVTISAINELTLNLKAGGVWEDMAAIYPFVGGTAGPCAVNLVNPGTYDIGFTGGWTFTSLGGQYDQSQGTYSIGQTWADTNLNENAFNNTGSAANIHISVAASYSPEITGYLMGVYRNPVGSTAQGTYIGVNSSGNSWWGQARGRVNQQYESPVAAIPSGYFLVSRELFSPTQIYYQKNGVGGTAAAANEGTVGNNYDIYIGARNDGGTTVSGNSTAMIEFATIGNGLTESKALALYNAVKIFNQRVGKTAI